MGKVFDALKKAEEERKAASARPAAASEAAAAGAPVAPTAPPLAPPIAPPLPPPPRASAPAPRVEEPRIERDTAPWVEPRPVPRRRRRMPSVGVGDSLRAAWSFVKNRGRETAGEETAAVKRRIIQFDPYSPAAEQFRAIRTRIELLNESGACRVLAVTSALPGEGKTLTTINLALVMAMSLERRVVLVDCDLRKPQVHSTLGLPVEFGLTEVLRGDVGLERALLEMPKENLTVLPAGALPSNPAELLGTQRLRDTIAALRERFDYVVIDTPAALTVSDPEIVCNLADGIIFVVRAGSTPREQVLRAMDNFNRERIVGVVLNSSEESEGRAEGED
jgi:capsular exopolysaccharide synthesis family protein